MKKHEAIFVIIVLIIIIVSFIVNIMRVGDYWNKGF